MTKPNTYLTEAPKEKALLVGVNIAGKHELLNLDDSMAELERLAETADVVVVGYITQNLRAPNSKTYIGSGKVEEVKMLADGMNADVVIFDNELSPRHQRELEESFGETLRVIDRTALILDIFAQHANTNEGSLQVELAQYEYRLPRLTRAWTHLARQAGGGGGRAGGVGGVGLRGPGETQLEVDRRIISRRIEFLKTELEKVRNQRSQYRQRRKKTQIPVVALVGYTNAGKSTLLNKLSNSDVYVADQYFATLDPTTRRVDLPGGKTVLFTDTVGFIQKLPTELVAAFRATLEEISDADVLIHMVDITHPNAPEQAKSVHETLVEIGAGEVPMVVAFNKIDLIQDQDSDVPVVEGYTKPYLISALTGMGLNELLPAVERELFESYIEVELLIPYQEGQLLSLFHETGQIHEAQSVESGTHIIGLLPQRLFDKFKRYCVQDSEEE